MSISSVSFRHFCLGLLNYRPMAGYDIKCLLEDLDWLVGGPSFGSIYSTLHALLDEGLVTVETVRRKQKPSRKVYSITEAGRQVLQDWVSQPVAVNLSLRAFAMYLVLAGNFTRGNLIAHLQQRHAQVAAQRAALEDTARAQNEKTGFQRLALDYGFALASSELAWLDSTLNRLLTQSLRMEVAQGN